MTTAPTPAPGQLAQTPLVGTVGTMSGGFAPFPASDPFGVNLGNPTFVNGKAPTVTMTVDEWAAQVLRQANLPDTPSNEYALRVWSMIRRGPQYDPLDTTQGKGFPDWSTGVGHTVNFLEQSLDVWSVFRAAEGCSALGQVVAKDSAEAQQWAQLCATAPPPLDGGLARNATTGLGSATGLGSSFGPQQIDTSANAWNVNQALNKPGSQSATAKGSSTHTLLITVLVLAIAGVAGYFWFQERKAKL